jgi:hypothetical protein
MNAFRIGSLFVALLVAHFAAADIRTITLASEISLSDFRVPASENGVASFKECESCELKVVAVTSDTRYEFNGHTVTLQDFRKSLSKVSNREQETVIVMRHLESDVITSISLSL